MTPREIWLLLQRRDEAERRADLRAAALGAFTSRTKRGGGAFTAEELWPSLVSTETLGPPSPELLKKKILTSMMMLGCDIPQHILQGKEVADG